ncbi:alpha/beta hydrolase [Halobaculum magnesiiphilum]|uniref:Alpha/beta fold hydrolase n=1 Tax=Halobaculum magnesiiphilum TaxID=1017351 RepID=A0A8T8WFX8_9EURY|nr:dienelactone hydrolase family protein [Halobaculum magnesiiphilum]QZP38772.1 alpha/beta fold hydrolase [Halobaculum magnesiiphilum]
MTDIDTTDVEGPHGGQPVRHAGADLADANAAVVMVHGRGATARSILGMAGEFGTDSVAYLAPAAARNTWYPHSFMEETTRNQPYLDSALAFVGRVVDAAADAVGREKVLLLGFSQGACLSSEWLARNADRFGGLVAFSGGLIGPEGTPREYDGDLDGTPAFLGCSDVDPHIPLERVKETTEVLEGLGADVDERIYEGMGHGVNEDELNAAKGMVTSLELAGE